MSKALRILYERYRARHEQFDHNRLFHRKELLERMEEENYDRETIYWVAESSDYPFPPIDFDRWQQSAFIIGNYGPRI